jgi:thioredoxin 1
MEIQSELVPEISHEEFNTFLSSEQILVANFFNDWCMNCLMMSPIIEDLASSLKTIKVFKLNIEENLELTQKFNIVSAPCTIIFKHGKEIERINGVKQMEFLEEKIRVHL